LTYAKIVALRISYAKVLRIIITGWIPSAVAASVRDHEAFDVFEPVLREAAPAAKKP
jgi:hypothetical protein